MKKLFKFIVIFLIIIVVAFGTLYTLTLSKGNYTKGNSSSIAGINKIRGAEKEGTAISINSTEFNDILSALYKNPKKKGNITIKTPEGFLQDKYIGFKVPVLYKGREILFYTKGTLECKDEKIIYSPESFKLGKLSLPKSFVMNTLKKYAGNNLIIENGNIEISKKLIPFSITSLDINNGILTMKIGKFEKDSLSNNEKNIEKKNSSKAAVLSNISGQLHEAIDSAGSAGGEQIISIMASCSSNMAANPSYNYERDVAKIKSIYSKLNSQQKAAVKAAIYSNINPENINELRNVFGM
jgi:uncharacterized protein YpmS